MLYIITKGELTLALVPIRPPWDHTSSHSEDTKRCESWRSHE